MRLEIHMENALRARARYRDALATGAQNEALRSMPEPPEARTPNVKLSC